MFLDKPASEMTTAQIINTLQELSLELQNRTVGLADVTGKMIPIVEYQKSTDRIMVVEITDLLAIRMMYLQRDSANKAVLFTDNQTIKDYIKAPIAFNKVVDEFNKAKKSHETASQHS